MALLRKPSLFLVTLVLSLAACRPALTPPPLLPEATRRPSSPSPPDPTATLISAIQVSAPSAPPPATSPPSRAIFLISFDGAPAGLVEALMKNGSLPHFAALAGSGLRAAYAQSVDPPLSAPAQIAIATGSTPAHTGIVSNTFHNPNDSFYWYRHGYEEPLDQAEPVWVTASRSGLVSAALFFPSGSPEFPGQAADYTIGYGVRDAYSRQVHIELSPAGDAWEGEIPASFSPPQEGSFQIPQTARVFVYLADSSDDGSTNYDTLLINTARRVEESTPHLRTGQWGPLVLLPNLQAGAEFLLQEIAQEQSPLQVTLYHSGVYHNTAAPRVLLASLNREFGFFPSGPDSYAVEHGWITHEDNLHLLERASRWLAEVSAWVYANYHPDLLYTWQDGLDSAGHAFTLQDSRQPGYSPERAEQYAGYFHQAVQAADQALEIMLRPVDLQNTTVILVSDHGMAPIHTTVYVNTLLERAGLLVLDRRDYVVENKSKSFAVASGGGVNVYIHLEGRENIGIVSPEEYPGVQQQVVDLLAGLSDPETGEPIFERILCRHDLAHLGLDHPNSGDVFAQANPGYNLDGWRGKNFIFEPATFYGQHGYDSTLPVMGAMFMAAGGGIPAKSEAIAPIRLVDIAPTIAALLGFTPAPTVDGQPIDALLR